MISTKGIVGNLSLAHTGNSSGNSLILTNSYYPNQFNGQENSCYWPVTVKVRKFHSTFNLNATQVKELSYISPGSSLVLS